MIQIIINYNVKNFNFTNKNENKVNKFISSI